MSWQASITGSCVRRTTLAAGFTLAAALLLSTGCRKPGTTTGDAAALDAAALSRSLTAGTRIPVALGGHLSSETAGAGDVWSGTTTRDVVLLNGDAIPVIELKPETPPNPAE